MDSFEHIDSLFTNPDRFMKGPYYAFKSHEEVIIIMFSGRMNILIDKVEKQLIVHYPWISDAPEKQIVLSFLLWGSSHVLMESKFDETVRLDTLTEAAKQIISLIDIQEPSADW